MDIWSHSMIRLPISEDVGKAYPLDRACAYERNELIDDISPRARRVLALVGLPVYSSLMDRSARLLGLNGERSGVAGVASKSSVLMRLARSEVAASKSEITPIKIQQMEKSFRWELTVASILVETLGTTASKQLLRHGTGTGTLYRRRNDTVTI